jgi:chitin disaccharide deacetylase
MPPPRSLIVNADDLGLSAAVNAGILEAHAHGIVTSASLMVRQPAAAEAVALVAAHPRLAIGLHLDLGQWDYRHGAWQPAYERCNQDDQAAVRAECRSQLRIFRELTGRDPTHLDSHQHVHQSEPVSAIAEALAAELHVPLRGRSAGQGAPLHGRGVRYEGGFYGQMGKGQPLPEAITVAALSELIVALPLGWSELGCHPGIGVTSAESSYARERELEVRALCHPSLPKLLASEEIALRSFAELDAST